MASHDTNELQWYRSQANILCMIMRLLVAQTSWIYRHTCYEPFTSMDQVSHMFALMKCSGHHYYLTL